MTSVLVLYYSMYDHIRQMAEAEAEGARQAGADVTIRRVPEHIPADFLEKMGADPTPKHPVLEDANAVAGYDAILFGTPTRFGNMAGQMRNFIDQMGGLWFQDKLVGTTAGVFTSTGSQHGGQETTLLSFITSLLHLGMIPVGLPYSDKRQMTDQEITGGSPYGPTTIAGDGSRQPSAGELGMARFHGAHVTEVATRLTRGYDGPVGFINVQ